MKVNFTHRFFDLFYISLLVFSGGCLLFIVNRNILSLFLFFISLFVLFFMGKKIKSSIFNSSVLSFLVFFLLLLINYYTALDSPNFLQYGFNLLIISTAFIFVIHILNNRSPIYFLESLYLILKFILYHSILSFFIYFFVSENLFDVTIGNHSLSSFMYIFYYTTENNVSIIGIDFIRNQGLFWEPGINQFYLNLLLFLEGFIFKKRKWMIFLIIFAIITTYSTTGYLIMMIILFTIMKSSFSRKPILSLLLLSFLIPFYFIAQTNLSPDEFQGSKQNSFAKRSLDLVQPIAIGLDYPLTGIGLDRDYFQDFRSDYQMEDRYVRFLKNTTGLEKISESTEKGSTNSITYLIASMGFPISLLLLYFVIRQELFITRKRIFLVILFLTLISEPILWRPFFLIFIVSGMISFFRKFTK